MLRTVYTPFRTGTAAVAGTFHSVTQITSFQPTIFICKLIPEYFTRWVFDLDDTGILFDTSGSCIEGDLYNTFFAGESVGTGDNR